MTIKSYLLIMTIATLICWASFGLVVKTINPDTTNWLGFSLFYVSLFLAFSGAAAIIGFVIRFIFLKKELIKDSVSSAFRQSFLISLFIVISLALMANNLLNWINILFLIVGLSVMEYFLLSYKDNSQPESYFIDNNDYNVDNLN